jgi:hypothetical protein
VKRALKYLNLHAISYAKALIFASILVILLSVGGIMLYEQAYQAGSDKMATAWVEVCRKGLTLPLKDITLHCGPVSSL